MLGVMGLDRVTALMEPRVTSLLTTFFWIAEGERGRKTTTGESKKFGQRRMFGTELPVRMSVKAASTLVESNAEVSMNMRPFFSGVVRAQGRKSSQSTNNDVIKAHND